MKHCTYCGKEYSDEIEICPVDGNQLKRVGETEMIESKSSDVQSDEMLAIKERQFWEQMNFRQFAILTIRLQAVWLIFYAIDVASYIPSYVQRLHEASPYGYADAKSALSLAVVRVLWHIAAAVILVCYAEPILNWFVKDWIANQPTKPKE